MVCFFLILGRLCLISVVFKFIRIKYICLLTKVIKRIFGLNRIYEKLVVSKANYELSNKRVLCYLNEQITFYTKKLYI